MPRRIPQTLALISTSVCIHRDHRSGHIERIGMPLATRPVAQFRQQLVLEHDIGYGEAAARLVHAEAVT